MSGRAAARLAWALWGATMLALLAIGGLAIHEPSSVTDELPVFVAFILFVLAFATVGALIASRRPANPIGWLMGAAAISFAVGGLSLEYAEYTLHAEPGSLPAGRAVAWVSTWVWNVGVGLAATYVILLFPDGRLPSRRWRPLAWLAGGGLALLIASAALKPGRLDEDFAVANPVGVGGGGEVLELVGAVSNVAVVVASVACVTSLLLRFRRAGPERRPQLKWLAYAGALVAVCVLAAVVIEALAGSSDAVTHLTNLLVTGSLTAMPVAIGIAVLRHRLYDIDRIINRTLVYGALTATLAGAYVGGVLFLQLALSPLTKQSDLAIAGSTLAVAALFRPARSRIQQAVDRRFFRRRYDAARTLEAFSARLRDELDLEALGAELRGVVSGTMEPAHVSLWLRAREGPQ